MPKPLQLDLPYPPRCRIPKNIEPVESIEVTLTLLDGSSRTTGLRTYSHSVNEISVLDQVTGDVQHIPINKLKTLALTASRQFDLAEDELQQKGSDITLPAERQKYEIIFTDGSTMSGETLGHIVDHHGLHIFSAQAFYNYQHIFIPLTAIDDYRIGDFIGQMLVKNQTISSEEMERGLELQTNMREQKLGDILRADSIVSSEQLEAALKKQQERPNVRLGEALVSDGLITEEQLTNALAKQSQNRATPLGQILIDMGLIDENEIQKTLASKLGIPFINIRKFQIDERVVKKIPEKISRRHFIMPLCEYDNKIIVAIENPMNRIPIEDVRFHTKIFVEPVMASKEDIEWAINRYYGSQINTLAQELDFAPTEDENDELEVNDSDNTLVKLVNKMIVDAHQRGVSDIHVEPDANAKKTQIRFRKDGSLDPYIELPYSYRNALVSRIKIMCGLDISERRKPQDGKIEFKKYGQLNIELRVATIPTSGGAEDVVMRVLSHGEPVPIEAMGFNDHNLREITRLTQQPYGLFLVCGPTGSGKTTTLHSILSKINTPERKIWTAEDPVEITQTGLRQVQVNPKIGLTFANAMRAFLRADPDIIMVGEMRDEETTGMGIEASLTGHMVFSTLHTNSAPESIVRLLDMGMDPFNFADALLGILAQRLAKKLCSTCKKPHFATDDELNVLYAEYFTELNYQDMDADAIDQHRKRALDNWKTQFGSPSGDITLYTAKGCDDCRQSGYEGRIALHELLVASKSIKALIQGRAPVSEILQKASREGMLTLKQDGIEKVLQGQTDIHQVHAVCIK